MPKKLIRDKVVYKLEPDEVEPIKDQTELNKLYDLKVKEELEEIKNCGRADVNEFADLVEAAYAYAKANGFSMTQVDAARHYKSDKNGGFSNVALTKLNPGNPSNKLYFNSK